MSTPLDPRYIPFETIEQILLDKTTGEPMSGGIVTFFRDSQRTQPKDVFQLTLVGGTYQFVSLGNTLTLSAIGSFEDPLGNPIIPYFFPFDSTGGLDLYYIVVTNAGGTPQFTREAQPWGAATTNPADDLLSFDNLISNPCFSDTFFDIGTTSITIDYTGGIKTTPIGVGWNLVASGTGSITLTKVSALGNQNTPTNPAYLLQVAASGSLSAISLQQTISASPNFLRGQHVTSGLVAKSVVGTTILSMSYFQSGTTGTITSLMAPYTFSAGIAEYHSDTAQIPTTSASTNSAPNASITVKINLPNICTVQISSVSLVATGESPFADLPYNETSTDEQTSGLFYYYEPQLKFKPSPSLLVGWDFPLNPVQFTNGTFNINAVNYVWDQTIGASVIGNVATSISAITQGIQFVNENAGEAFYIMQYLGNPSAQELIGNPISVNIFAWANTIDVTARVYLFRATAAAAWPSVTAHNSIGTINLDGTFTLTAPGWTQINPLNYTNNSGVLSQVVVNSAINNVVDLQFPGFEITDSTQLNDTAKFAIVVTFKTPTLSTTVTVDSISVTKGMIPTRPAPQAYSEVIRECQFYYEQTYNFAQDIGLANKSGAYFISQSSYYTGASHVEGYPTPFNISYQEKRTAPGITLFNARTGATDSVDFNVFYFNSGIQTAQVPITASTTWSSSIGLRQANFTPLSIANVIGSVATGIDRTENSAGIKFHAIIDARIGIV